MKKIIALILVVASLLALVSCAPDFYEPQESTELEATTVMTVKYGNLTYEIKYELYRAFFLTYKSTVDGGDESVWSGEDRDRYIEQIQSIIIDKVLDIYSTFALASSIGIDPYSAEIGKRINEYVKLSVDGGDANGQSYPGYPSYSDYLAALKKLNLNYSVQTLLFRYSIVSGMIDDYFLGGMTEDDVQAGELTVGKLEYTKDDVERFYMSDECVRVLRTFISEDMDTNHEQRAKKVRDAIADIAQYGEERVRMAMLDEGSITAQTELENGFVMGRYNLSLAYYSEMVDAAFALDIGDVSNVITIHDGEQLKHYIIYRAEKSDEHFEDNYASIAYIYLRNKVGEKYKITADAMRETVEMKSFLDTLDHASISMD